MLRTIRRRYARTEPTTTEPRTVEVHRDAALVVTFNAESRDPGFVGVLRYLATEGMCVEVNGRAVQLVAFVTPARYPEDAALTVRPWDEDAEDYTGPTDFVRVDEITHLHVI